MARRAFIAAAKDASVLLDAWWNGETNAQVVRSTMTAQRRGKMLKFIGGGIGFIFLVGLLVIIGILMLIF